MYWKDDPNFFFTHGHFEHTWSHICMARLLGGGGAGPQAQLQVHTPLQDYKHGTIDNVYYNYIYIPDWKRHGYTDLGKLTLNQ